MRIPHLSESGDATFGGSRGPEFSVLRGSSDTPLGTLDLGVDILYAVEAGERCEENSDF